MPSKTPKQQRAKGFAHKAKVKTLACLDVLISKSTL
jgi:hypothetical protein